MQERNYLGQALGLTALVTAALLILSAVSKKTTVSGIEIRKIDILSDLHPVSDSIEPEAESAYLPVDTLQFAADADTLNNPADSAALAEPALIPRVDSVRFGRIIEDYTFDQQGMSTFWKAIDQIRSKQKKVRVAFFGDSFIEGDILLADLRDTLQSVWGGDGVGFVPLTSEVARFRRTFVQNFHGWRTWSIIHPDGHPKPFGLDGHVYLPEPGAYLHVEGTSQYHLRHTRAWGDVRFFYTASSTIGLQYQFNGQPAKETLLSETAYLKTWEHSEGGAHINKMDLRFPNTAGLTGYGMSLENGPGIYFDNFSVRGNAGGRLGLLTPETARQFDQVQQYDLIILQYGLNAVTNSTRNVRWYEAELDRTYKHIRKCFPNTPILIISVPDRGGKNEAGNLTTMRGVPAIVNMQRELARKHGFLFYDFYYGMGGPGTMVRLANTKPRLANLDYTHLTHEGGRVVGVQMAQMFLNEQLRWRNMQ